MDKKLLDALAAKAEQRKVDKTKAKQFEVGGQMLDFVKIGHTAQLDAYEACPALQDPELHTALGVTDPYDVIWVLMDVREVNALAASLFAWLGLIAGDEDEDPAKN